MPGVTQHEGQRAAELGDSAIRCTIHNSVPEANPVSTHRSRFCAMCLVLASPLLAPGAAHAQLDIHVVPGHHFVMPQPMITDVPLSRFLTEGTMVRAETRSSPEVVLFVARMSRGKLVAQGMSAPFRLDAKSASSSAGMLLGAALNKEQLLTMPPLAGLGDAIVASQATPDRSLAVADLLEEPGAVFLLGGGGGGGIGGLFAEEEHVLLIAVVPAQASRYARSLARPMALALQGALH